MLSEQSINKYREIYRHQFGVELSREEATEQALRLLNVARVVFAPIPRAWEGRYNELLAKKGSKETHGNGNSTTIRKIKIVEPDEIK
jgi:hypothetical protein